MMQVRRPEQTWPGISSNKAMPRFYFDIYNDDVTQDPEGTELRDDTAALAFAVKQIRSLAADTVLHGHFTASHRLEILDVERNQVASMRFDEAVDVRP